jgi:hypothetical protein
MRCPPRRVNSTLAKVYVLIPHTLESGGLLMSRGNLFTGQHAYVSGGSVTTFSLFSLGRGGIVCSGNRYAYSGMFKDDKFQNAIIDDKFKVAVPKEQASDVSRCGKIPIEKPQQ